MIRPPNNRSDILAARAWLVLMAIALAMLLIPRAFASGDVIAHASEDMLWVGQVIRPPEGKGTVTRTSLRFRILNAGDQAWRELQREPLVGRVTQIANRGQTAAVLMESGEWMLLWPDGKSTGPSLPRHAKMLALASDREVMYAIAAPTPAASSEPVELPATEPSSSAATSQPAVSFDKPILYAFQGVGWKALANCPETTAQAPGEISLAVVSRALWLAQPEAGGSIHVYKLDDEQKWNERGAIKPPDDASGFKLIGGTQRQVLWIGDKSSASSGGVVYLGSDEKWGEPIKLELSRPVPASSGNLVAAAGSLRLFLEDDRGKLFEQRFDKDTGARSGEIAPLQAAVPTVPQAYDNWPMIALVTATAFMMLSSARRRATEQLEEHEPDAIVLAASGQRLLAGLIDAVPLVFSSMYVAGNLKELQDASDLAWSLPVILALAVYMLHTTVSELLTGRTIGKTIVGLQVVAIDGTPAKPGAILVRNLLRLIDIFPVPLAFLIVLSPMKQRLGDLLAGTIVVIGPRPSAEDQSDEPK